MRQERPRQSHHRGEVDSHQPVEIGLVDLLERPADRDSGVVEQQVHAAMRSEHRGGQRQTLLAVADVDAMSTDLDVADHCRSLVDARLIDVGQREVAATLCQGEGNAATDPASRAGDYRRPSAKFHATLTPTGAPQRMNFITPSSSLPSFSAAMSSA